MTETTQDLLARLAGFTPGPYTAEYDDETWRTRIYTPDGTLIGELGTPYFDTDDGIATIDKIADLLAAAPDLHRIATEQAAEIARLRDALTPLLEFASKYGGSPKHEKMLSQARAELAVQP